METNWNRATTEPEREQRGSASSTFDRGPAKPGKRKSASRSISDDELVRLLTRRTGRSHERWLPLLAAARAARAPASRSRPAPRPALRSRTAGDLEDLLAALRRGPVDLDTWHDRRGLSKLEASKLLRALRRRGHRIERESRPGRYKLLPPR